MKVDPWRWRGLVVVAALPLVFVGNAVLAYHLPLLFTPHPLTAPPPTPPRQVTTTPEDIARMNAQMQRNAQVRDATNSAPRPTRVASGDGDLLDAASKMLDAFCGMNLRYIDSAFDAANVGGAYGRTTCRIVSYRESSMILFTAEKPVFRIPAARKAWALIAVATAGKTIRDLGGELIGIDYVGLTDSEQAKGNKVALLPASYAEKLQAALHDGKVEVADALEDLDSRLQESIRP